MPAVSAPITLWCYVLGDEPCQVFSVEIDSGKVVAVLRKVIKANNPNSLLDASSNELNLWAVSIPLDDNFSKMLEVPPSSQDMLKPWPQVVTYFPQVENGHLHVVVERREQGPFSVSSLHSYINF